MTRLLRALTSAMLLVAAAPAAAQVASTVDLSAASLGYENDYEVSAVSLSPSFQLERGRASLLATGTLSRFEDGAIGSSGSFFGSLLAPPFGVLRRMIHGEAIVSVGGSTHEDDTRTARYLGQLRMHVPFGDGGVWLGGGAGQAWRGEEWRMVSLADAGAWWRRGAALMSASVAPARAGDTTWTDVIGSLRWTRGALEGGAVAGMRVGSPDDDGAWAAVSGAFWITRRIALSATAGTYRADHAMALPGGRYVSAGLRIASRPRVLDPARLGVTEPPRGLRRPVAGRLTVHDAGDGRRTVRIDAPGARNLEIMGDFTEWQVVALEQGAARGAWELTLPLSTGDHRFNVRVDGGDWGVPLAVTAITDDFGGVVGILVVR